MNIDFDWSGWEDEIFVKIINDQDGRVDIGDSLSLTMLIQMVNETDGLSNGTSNK